MNGACGRYHGQWTCWFRIWRNGPGLHISNRKRDEALFSERYGYVRARYIAGIRIQVLHAEAR